MRLTDEAHAHFTVFFDEVMDAMLSHLKIMQQEKGAAYKPVEIGEMYAGMGRMHEAAEFLRPDTNARYLADAGYLDAARAMFDAAERLAESENEGNPNDFASNLVLIADERMRIGDTGGARATVARAMAIPGIRSEGES